jgi:RHS repeat-associated protein
LLAFGSSTNPLQYDDSNDLTSVTPYVNGTAESTDTYTYDDQQRITSGPETSSSITNYDYTNTGGSPPFSSTNTVDQMDIDASPLPGSAAQLGSEYAGNGEVCWTAKNPTSTTGTCSSPSSSASEYETFSYDASGDLTGTTPAGGYGTTSTLMWDQDTGTLSCINASGSTCTTPGSSTPETASYSYNGDGLRMTAATWNTSTNSVQDTEFTWETPTSALLSDGVFDYVYGQNGNVPIAQIDTGDSVTSELLTGTNSAVRAVVEISSGAASPFTLANYTDYDAYGNPITKNGGTTNVGGLTNEVGSDPDSSSSFGFGGGISAGQQVYLVHRYYAPQSGLFASSDPLVYSTDAPYTYASDDPTMDSDWAGLAPGNDLSAIPEYHIDLSGNLDSPTSVSFDFKIQSLALCEFDGIVVYGTFTVAWLNNFDHHGITVQSFLALGYNEAGKSLGGIGPDHHPPLGDASAIKVAVAWCGTASAYEVGGVTDDWSCELHGVAQRNFYYTAVGYKGAELAHLTPGMATISGGGRCIVPPEDA